MKKEFIKKISTLSLIGTLLIPTLVFANDTTTTTTVPTATSTSERPARGDMKDRPAGDKGDFGKAGHEGYQFGGQTLELITLYAPELFDQYQTAIESEKSIRDSINELRKNNTTDHKASYETLLETIRTELTAGTITRAEAKTKLEAFKTSIESDKDTDTLKTQLEALKTTYGINQDANKTLMTTLKTAIDNNDETAIKTSLETMLTQLQKHVEYDQAVYNLLSAQ